MLLRYSTANSLSITAMTNLFTLINTIFKTPVLPDSRYITDKLLNSEDGVQFHAVCYVCSAYLGEFGKIASTKVCNNCRTEIDLHCPSNTSFFVLINPTTQITDLLHIYEEHYDNVINERIHKIGYIEDVYDGKKYREFVKSLPEHDKLNYVSAVLNTDGAEKFKSSQYSIWPLFLKISELPSQDRSNKLVTCGLWFNKQKPEFPIFLNKFVELVNNITNQGISCIIKGEPRLLKLHILSCCVDSVARAPVQGVKQFNGKFGCNWCLHPGKYAENSMKYPSMNELPHSRNHEETVKLMVEKNFTFGIKYASPLINLSSFDIVLGFVPDYLHCSLEGIAKQFTSYFLESLNEDDIANIDHKMNQIAAPCQVARLCRPLSCRKVWKAREWENFVLFYSIPIFSSILSANQLSHWSLFVESMYILLKDSIHINELNKADEILHKFVWETEELYGVPAMTFNLHQHLHICEAVLNWGPLWTNSTFCFETANHYLLKAIQCARGVTQQVVRFVHINHSILIIENCVMNEASAAVTFFCDDVISAKVRNTFQITNLTYFGEYEYVDSNTINSFHLSEDTKCYKKMVKDRCLYESFTKYKLRSNNSFALLKDGQFIRIIAFIVDEENEKEITMCNLVNTRNHSQSYKTLQKIENIETEKIYVQTKNISRICIFMNVSNVMYICPLPNSLHY